ncbi:hypothetical protein PoB_006460600 [Plakobranchus ocellatus]|uniref:Uncharacterized protein n=1 Tax=Plakobranchus ocellatus TaxID=259542 RepID=A0AAV4D268_9GAST|nr:hypothetical protein PoB_006460600 [Plakobranchus ocellatus]
MAQHQVFATCKHTVAQHQEVFATYKHTWLSIRCLPHVSTRWLSIRCLPHPFDEINTELQSEAPKIHILHSRLEKLQKSLQSRKDKAYLREELLTEFYSKVKHFYITAVKYIFEKLPYNDELLQHATILDQKQQLHAKLASLEYFLKRFPVLIPHTASVAAIKMEFGQYQS